VCAGVRCADELQCRTRCRQVFSVLWVTRGECGWVIDEGWKMPGCVKSRACQLASPPFDPRAQWPVTCCPPSLAAAKPLSPPSLSARQARNGVVARSNMPSIFDSQTTTTPETSARSTIDSTDCPDERPFHAYLIPLADPSNAIQHLLSRRTGSAFQHNKH